LAVARVRGFTLLEILVVMAIAALALALTLPNLGRGVSTLEIKSAARELASGLRYARAQAIARKQEIRLLLDTQQRRYRIDQQSRVYQLPAALQIKLLVGQAEVTGEGIGGITFFPDGTSTGGRITLANDKRQMIVDAQWLTGRVAIYE